MYFFSSFSLLSLSICLHVLFFIVVCLFCILYILLVFCVLTADYLFGVLNLMMMIVGLYRTLCSADVRTVVCSNDLVSSRNWECVLCISLIIGYSDNSIKMQHYKV